MIFRKVIWHLLVFILILYIINYIERINLGFPALTLNLDLDVTPFIFGLISRVFFLEYILFEYLSNQVMERVGT